MFVRYNNLCILTVYLCGRRMKAAFAAYKERQLPIVKEEKPGLKQSQYQDMIFKSWQKSPENPLIRAQLAGTR